MTEEFRCARCGYHRALLVREDGFRLYLLHEERCRPKSGQQLWLPMITEDHLRWQVKGNFKHAFSNTDPRLRPGKLIL